MGEFETALNRLVRRLTGNEVGVQNLVRLTGGANMESWSFDCDGQGYVLRRSPAAGLMAGRQYGHDVEAAVVRAAFRAGVKAPEIVGEILAEDALGTGYLMRRVEAEVSPAKILTGPPRSLLADLARELAAIHAVPLDTLPALPAPETAVLLTDMKAKFMDFGGDRPVMAVAFKWLEDHLPPPVEPVLLHGDFRMGNIMAAADGLAAVLDWELAHLGDRHQDLAFGCINSWRFGHIDRPAFGVGRLKELWTAYEALSGVTVDPARFRYWLIYSTLWWGICCLQMAEIWRSGLDAGLERAVIGRRASETEVDLLMLLEEDAPEEEKYHHPELVSGSISPIEPGVETDKWIVQRVQDDGIVRQANLGEPSASELLTAISQWIETEIKPVANGRDRFMASVALNALGMLQRENVSPVEVHDRALSDDLIAGRKSLATPGLLAQLKAQSLAKLAADQPRYSAFAKARELWT